MRPIITQPYIYRNVSCYTYLCDCLWLNRARWMKMFRRFCFKSSVWHTKVKISNWQQYEEFKWLLYVPLNRSVSPLCTANKRHWNCEWEDIVLEHDRDDYISCMWWFMRDSTDTFVPHFNKLRNAADVPFFVTLRLTLCLQASHSTECKIHFVVKSTSWWISVLLKRCVAYHR